MNYSEAVNELVNRGSDRKEPALETTEKALKELEKPENNYRVILVGGTNGKGSTVEMISELLQRQGFDVGTFKSPHLTTPRERIKVNGEKISREDFFQLYQQINPLDLQLSFFEFMTAMAYLYFSEREVDYAVMEVGMGGRLDATNAAENETAVITNIGLDHTKYLGETREEIATEKAGIIPENGKLITQSNSDLLKQKARKKNTELLKPSTEHTEIDLPVKGQFQHENLATALKTVETAEKLPENTEDALENLECPGRMEKVNENPLTVPDGAHNPDALEKTVEDLPDDFICVFAARETKNIQKMLEILEQKASEFYITKPLDVPKMAEPSQIEGKISRPCKVFREPVEALETAREQEEKPVVVTGSLYLVGELRDEAVKNVLQV